MIKSEPDKTAATIVTEAEEARKKWYFRFLAPASTKGIGELAAKVKGIVGEHATITVGVLMIYVYPTKRGLFSKLSQLCQAADWQTRAVCVDDTVALFGGDPPHKVSALLKTLDSTHVVSEPAVFSQKRTSFGYWGGMLAHAALYGTANTYKLPEKSTQRYERWGDWMRAVKDLAFYTVTEGEISGLARRTWEEEHGGVSQAGWWNSGAGAGWNNSRGIVHIPITEPPVKVYHEVIPRKGG